MDFNLNLNYITVCVVKVYMNSCVFFLFFFTWSERTRNHRKLFESAALHVSLDLCFSKINLSTSNDLLAAVTLLN